jgi:hypothetical protein
MMSKRIATCLLALMAAGAVSAAEPPPAPNATAQKETPAAPATARDAQPAVKTSTAGSQQAAQPQGTRRGQSDRLELDTTVVTGNRELPKVLYIVPWKKANIGELPAQPFNTLLDEVLTPVDRDVFRREVTYYDAVSAGAPAGGAEPPSSGGAGDGLPDGSEK